MMNKIKHWHAEGQHQHDPNEQFFGSEYQLIRDGRFYGTIVLTCDGLEAIRPDAENPKNATHHRQTYDYIRENSKKYTRERNTRDVYAEDINTKAEEFIQMEHQKFNVRTNKRTWSSG